MSERLGRGDAWALTALILLVAALILRDAPLALLGAGLLAGIGAVALWRRHALRAIHAIRTGSSRRSKRRSGPGLTRRCGTS